MRCYSCMCWIISALIWTVLVYSDFISLVHMCIEAITYPDIKSDQHLSQDFGMHLLFESSWNCLLDYRIVHE